MSDTVDAFHSASTKPDQSHVADQELASSHGGTAVALCPADPVFAATG
jgi:hypothetical protein